MLTVDPARLAAAAAAAAGWLSLVGLTVRQQRRLRAAERRAAAALAIDGRQGAAPMIVAHASQTGTAERLAWHCAEALHRTGRAVRLASLATLTRAELAASQEALLVVSTYGEGDPPDAASPFVRNQMVDGPALASLRFGLLALGDRDYANFCGFGRQLEHWLLAQGARPLFERIDVDGEDPVALGRWRDAIAELGADAASIAPPPDAARHPLRDWQPWRIAARRLLNAGSIGEAVWQLELEPADAALQATILAEPPWQAGDLLQVTAPADAGTPRDYSIASIPVDGRVHLLVRVARRADGSPGLASDWLVRGATPADEIRGRLKPHPGFRIAGNAGRPLILIGNGTGLAGLRALLRERAAGPGGTQPGAAPAASAAVAGVAAAPGATRPACWLIFGERHAAHDRLLDDEITAWLDSGLLSRCDRVFSRDGAALRYVQDAVAANADAIRRWVDDGAAIYVCGSLKGMAGGVDDALAAAVGRARLDGLIGEGRYRRDVY